MSVETSHGGETREQILRAAEDVIGEVGMRAATTRAIAQRAGCAEGSIYRYFADKSALFIEIAKARYPTFLDLVATLPERAGTRTVERNLTEIAEAAMEFFRAVVPMIAGILAEHRLLDEHRRSLRGTRAGPMRAFADLEEYLRREQALGRIAAAASPSQVARLVLTACFGQTFLAEMVGPDAELGSEDFARSVVRAALAGAHLRTRTAARTG